MADIGKMKDVIFNSIKENQGELAKLNDDIADHPEISCEEFETSKKLVKTLKDKGYNVEYPFDNMDTAFRGIYGENNHKYKVAILTEYDALPGIGHACGHCLSGSISLLAGISLKELQDELDTDVHIIGTPMEETDGAKCQMTLDGIFDNYDMAIMVHLYDENLIAPKLFTLDSYRYKFHGKAAHAGSCPWEGVNALNGAQLMFHAIDMMRQHVTPDTRLHGIYIKGGEMAGIVPEEAEIEIWYRSLDRDYSNELFKRIEDCAKGAAIATQCTYESAMKDQPYDNLKANPTGEAVLEEVFNELDIPLNGDTSKIFGSSDAGNVSFVCPTFHPCLQVVDKGIAIHTREFAAQMKSPRAHETLGLGAKLIALQIAKIFSDEEKIKAMKADFERK